jgi:hypothetical protein
MYNKHKEYKIIKSFNNLLNDSDMGYYFYETLVSVDDIKNYSGTDDFATNYAHLKDFYLKSFKYINIEIHKRLHNYFNPINEDFFFVKFYNWKSVPTQFKLSKNLIRDKVLQTIPEHRIKYIFSDLNYLEFVGKDVDWPEVKSRRIQSRNLGNFEKHFWNSLNCFLDADQCELHGSCDYLSSVKVSVLTIENRLVGIDLIDDTDLDIRAKAIHNELVEILDYFEGFLGDEGHEIYIGLHLHKSSAGGMETGDIEALSPMAFEKLASRYMDLFSDIFSTNSAETITEFKVISVFKGKLLCQCISKGIYFVIQYPDFIIYTFEDYIYAENPFFEDDITEVSPEIGLALLNNLTFSLDMDFIYVDKIEVIGKSITLIQDVIRRNA